MLRRGLRTILEMVNALLSRQFGRRYKSLGLTEYAVRFSLTSDDRQGSIDVDLLPSPYWSYAEELHYFLAGLSSDIRRKWVTMATVGNHSYVYLLYYRFSCSAAKWQKEFILSQPPQASFSVVALIQRFLV